jgi:RNA polymerase sigma factor (sigma-70 family)
LLVGNQGATARSAAAPHIIQKGGFSMTEFEEYQEHIQHTHNAFCRIVIRHASIDAARKLYSKWKQEISLEYLSEEKFMPFAATDEYFAKPPSSEEYPFTVCGQNVMLSNPDLAAALSSLPEAEQEIIFLYFFEHLTHAEIGKRYGRTRSTAGRHIYLDLRRLREEMEVLAHEQASSL